MTEKYLEQYQRMIRSYDKFAEINKGRPHDLPSVHYEDDIYTFFMHCYHLKDWIQNDGSVKARFPSIGRDVEDFIDNSEYLRLAADLCNLVKHLKKKPNRRSRSGESPAFGRKQFHYEMTVGGAEPSQIKLKWSVERQTKGPIDAFDLATECVAAWDRFLSSKKLK